MHHKYQLQCIIRHHSASQRIRRHHRALQDILQCITRHHSTPQRSTTQYKTPIVSKETSGVSIWRPAAACSRCCLEAIDLTYASDTRTGSNQRLFLQSRKPAPYKTSRRMTSQGITAHDITGHHSASQGIPTHHNESHDIITHHNKSVKGDLRGVHLAACGRMFPLLSRGNWSHICIRHTHGQQPTIVPSQFALVFGLALVFAFSFVFVFVFTCVFTGRIASLYLHLYLRAFSFVSAFVFAFVFTGSKSAEAGRFFKYSLKKQSNCWRYFKNSDKHWIRTLICELTYLRTDIDRISSGIVTIIIN